LVEIISEPIEDRFYNLVIDSNKCIRLCSPFIKESIVKRIYKNKKSNVKIDYISNFNLGNFYKKSSDIKAFEEPVKYKDKIYNCQMLHAKFYIFDDEYTIVTSSNLTPSGFKENLEYGVFINDKVLVNQTVNDFKAICNSEITGKIGIKEIIKIKRILNSFPSYKDINLYDKQKEIDGILHIDKELLEGNLSNWQNTVFKVINLIGKDEFSLSDIYNYKHIFKKVFPNNNTIRNSIRRTLQELRDLGLVKFYGNGRYKKLWNL